MKVTHLNIKATNKFATDYLSEAEDVLNFFDYTYKDQQQFEKRKRELSARNFNRAALANHIEEFMKNWSTKATLESIERLKHESSLVVIGGQQAGLFTGPLYSIHKVLSVLQLAKQQEEKLNVPVIPIFWIAGEDHDYQEVNHIYLHNEKEVKKFTDAKKLKTKPMVSRITVDRLALSKQLEEAISFLGETNYSKEVLHKLRSLIETSTNYVDFFSSFIMELFKDTPLLLVDSGNQEFKQLQKEFLQLQINHAKEINDCVLSAQQQIKQKNYPLTLEQSNTNANLFFYDEDKEERILLDYVDDQFIHTEKSILFSKEKMLEFALQSPEVISNNVVTRPLMQELLFPTLAFIGGPGEISYWAELKQVFELFQLKMPIIVPRVNITLVDTTCLNYMNQLNISMEEALSGQVEEKKLARLSKLRDLTIPNIIEETLKLVQGQYDLMKENVTDVSLLPIMEKNEQLVSSQLQFLNKKVERSFLLKEDTLIRQYDYVDNHLYPQHTYQERKLNILQFLNENGLDFVNKLTLIPLKFDGTHHIIEI